MVWGWRPWPRRGRRFLVRFPTEKVDTSDRLDHLIFREVCAVAGFPDDDDHMARFERRP